MSSPMNFNRAQGERKTDRDALSSSLREGRCLICAVLKAEEWDLLCRWVGLSLPEKAEERGVLKFPIVFCTQHFWKLADVNTSQGNATLCRDLLRDACEHLRNGAGFPQGPDTMSSQVGLACPICGVLAKRDRELGQAFCDLLNDSETRESLLGSRGLCLPHTGRCYGCLHDPALKEVLLTSCREQLDQLKRELDVHLAKSTPPLRWERTVDEEKAPVRGIEKLVGGRSLPSWSDSNAVDMQWPG